MISNGYCPQCNCEIPAERHAGGLTVCKCGWYDTREFDRQSALDKKQTIRTMVAAFGGLGLFLALLISWGPHAFSIPFLKAGQLTGLLSNQGHRDVVAICIELGKMDCAQEAYLDLYKRSGDLTALSELAHLQFRLGEVSKSSATYAAYFKFGGKDGEAAVRYGAILEGENRHAEAITMYESSITARPEVLPVHATTGIVRSLIKLGRYPEARERILAFHESDQNAPGYLNSELASLDAQLGPRPTRKANAKNATGNQS